MGQHLRFDLFVLEMIKRNTNARTYTIFLNDEGFVSQRRIGAPSLITIILR